MECTRISVPSSELGPSTPSPACEFVSPLDPKGGGGNTCGILGVKGGGTQYGRLDKKPDTLYTLLYKGYSGEVLARLEVVEK